MSDEVVPPVLQPLPPSSAMLRRPAGWGGKALLVCVLALAMAIPGLFVFALVTDRAHRATDVVKEVSALQGGPQQALGPVLAAPYTLPAPTGADRPVTGWYVVSPEQGSVKMTVHAASLRRGLFHVPVFDATADFDAKFGPAPVTVNLPSGAKVDWSQARVVMGFSDLRGARADVSGNVTVAGAAATALAVTPAAVRLGSPVAPDGANARLRQVTSAPGAFGLVAAPAAALAAAPGGGVVHARLRFSGAARLGVMPFAKSTTVAMNGDWPTPSFDGGFLPEARTLAHGGFNATWTAPFIARGLTDHGDESALGLGELSDKDFGVTFLPPNDPYQNVTRSLKYAVMVVGLVFLTFFVFEALSGRRVHAAQYVLIGLAQTVFYLLLLSLAEHVGFDAAFALAATATVGLIGLYAGAAFQSAAYRWRALAVFALVYGLIYLLMRLEDFALLAGSVAAFAGLAAAMYLTRRLDWYGVQAAAMTPVKAPG